MYELLIYDTREDWEAETPQGGGLFRTEQDAHRYMHGYGEYFEYEVKPMDERLKPIGKPII